MVDAQDAACVCLGPDTQVSSAHCPDLYWWIDWDMDISKRVFHTWYSTVPGCMVRQEVPRILCAM